MKVLFFVEPFAIRGHWSVTQWVVERYYRSLTDGKELEGRIFCNRRLGQNLLEQGADRKRILTPTLSRSSCHFNDMGRRWGAEEVEAWSSYLRGEGGAAATLRDLLDDIREEFDFEGIVVWGTNRALRAYAVEHGIPILFSELGPVRPPFGFWGALDSYGVNGDALPTRLTLDQVTKTDAARLFDLDQSATPTKILIALQCADDSNVTVHQGDVSYSDYVLQVAQRSVEAGCEIVIAPHPGGNRYRHTYISQIDLLSRLQDMPRVQIADGETHSYFSWADIVFSYNSSASFEAIIAGTPSQIGGRASYAPSGFNGSGGELLTSLRLRPAELKRYLLFMSHYYTGFDSLFDLSALRSNLEFWRRIEAVNKESAVEMILSRKSSTIAPAHAAHK